MTDVCKKLTKKYSTGSNGGGGYSQLRVMLVLVKVTMRRFAGMGSPTEKAHEYHIMDPMNRYIRLVLYLPGFGTKSVALGEMGERSPSLEV